MLYRVCERLSSALLLLVYPEIDTPSSTIQETINQFDALETHQMPWTLGMLAH
jgi:hypothetical protein